MNLPANERILHRGETKRCLGDATFMETIHYSIHSKPKEPEAVSSWQSVSGPESMGVHCIKLGLDSM